MPNVTLPSTQKFLHAILQYLKAYPEGVRRRDIYYGVADVIPLSGEQRHATTQNGIPKHHYRSGFSLGILRSSNLIENPEFGVWRITKEGLALLAEQPRELNVSTAQELIALSKNGTLENDKAEETTPLNPVAPEERLETALMEIKHRLAKELLAQIFEQPYDFLEKLVLDLLREMYGVPSEGTQHIGQSGDQGIDGIVALDKLGFDKIYIQAKRWQANVGGPDVQKFIGALSQKKAQKGVFITTSLFTPDARIAAKSQSPPIVLIDGPALCKLMIEHGVGVERRQIHVPGFSLDYFGLSA